MKLKNNNSQSTSFIELTTSHREYPGTKTVVRKISYNIDHIVKFGTFSGIDYQYPFGKTIVEVLGSGTNVDTIIVDEDYEYIKSIINNRFNGRLQEEN